MPFAEIFKGLLGGDPVKSIGDLIGQFHLSPEDKAKLQQATQELEVRRDEIEAARDQALAQIQSQNITAETKSDDPYVRRARPTFPLCDHRCDGLFPHRRARHQRLPAQGLGADADSRLLPRTIRVCLPRLYGGEVLGKDEGDWLMDCSSTGLIRPQRADLPPGRPYPPRARPIAAARRRPAAPYPVEIADSRL